MRFDGDAHVPGDSDKESKDDEGDSRGEEEEEEEEEWGGVSGANGTVQDAEDEKHTGTKPKKPPTGEELRNIKDATDLYRSSSFKLQVRTLSSHAGLRSLVCLDRRAPAERPSEIHKILPSGTLPSRPPHIPRLTLIYRA